MMFALSKLLSAIFQPSHVIFLLVLTSVICLILRPRSRTARLGTLFALALFGMLSILPVGHALLRLLEDRFPAVAPPSAVDGILVLGGAVQPGLSADRGQIVLNEQAERMTEAVMLALQYPSARVVFTGGNAALWGATYTEAQFARGLFERMHIARSRALYEDRSRNTFENARFSKELVEPAPGETWLLVTSALHMPRAMGCFRAVGWTLVPWPVDFRSSTSLWENAGFDVAGKLTVLDYALHEWVGLLAYWMMGHSSALFPGP